MKGSLVTVFSDASFCPKTKIGTWAAWGKCNGISRIACGRFKSPCVDSNITEAFALIEGLKELAKLEVILPKARIVAQLDSQNAVHILTGSKEFAKDTSLIAKKYDKQIKQANYNYTRFISSNNYNVEFRHVKGHRGNGTRRNAVNTKVDNICHVLLRYYRGIKLGTIPVDKYPTPYHCGLQRAPNWIYLVE